MPEKAQELTEHEVLINGVPHTLLLSDEDAERYETAEPKSKAKTPANKSRSAADK